MKTIAYKSDVWDIRTSRVRKALLYVHLYESKNPTGIMIWIPGMSDKPIADKDNPLLSYFVPRAIKKGFSIAIICFPGTYDRRFVEERTLSTMKQNVFDAISILAKRIPNYAALKKILIGRSAGGTLITNYLDNDFDMGISIAGRLKLTKLYRRIKASFGQRSFYPINSIKPFLRIRYPIKTDGKLMYCLNAQYVKELGEEEQLVEQSFTKANTISLLAIQAKDDDIVPFQLDRWKQLANRNKIPISLFPLSVSCGHSFNTQPAIRLTTKKILSIL